METQRGFTRRFRMGESIRDNPIMEAIFDDNVEQFKALITADRNAVTNVMFLYYVIKLRRVEMFDFLLTFDNFDPDCPDNIGRNMLMGVASVPQSERFALALIDRGANVNWRDGGGFTYLHMAAKAVDVDNTTVGQVVIERGADVNAVTDRGETPLYIACEEGNYSFSCLLLYYGADATLATSRGILPVVATSRWVPPDLQSQLQELLFDYTFDDDKGIVSLSTLVEAMVSSTPLFTNIVENISDVTFNHEDLEHFCGSLKYLQPQNLQLFLNRFGNIVKALIRDCRLLITVVELGWIFDNLSFKDILDAFVNCEYFPEMVQASDPTYSTIACLVEVFNQKSMLLEREEVAKIVYIMLTYGLGVTSLDLDVVYKYYGYCELFRILLHMDILVVRKEKDNATVASLYYQPDTDVAKVLWDRDAVNLLDYYSNPTLKEVCLSSHADNDRIVEKVKSLPQVPLLSELSRNVARKYIVSRYQTKNSRQFYTVLKSLPIGEVNKKIIALERKLYCWF